MIEEYNAEFRDTNKMNKTSVRYTTKKNRGDIMIVGIYCTYGRDKNRKINGKNRLYKKNLKDILRDIQRWRSKSLCT